MDKGQFAYIVDQLGATFAFEHRSDALISFIEEDSNDAQNLTIFKVRAPRAGMTMNEIAEYAVTHGPEIEDE